MNQDNPKEIAHYLKSLLLCCCSSMSGSIETLMKAYRFKLHLEISGLQNPGYSLFVKMAKRLGVDFEEVDIRSTGASYTWLSDHTTPNQRVWIPDMQNRDGDFHVLCPFFFSYHLNELRKHEPDFPAPKVDSLYVLLLWALCFGSRKAPLSARILKDLLAWERRGILTAHRYVGFSRDEIPIVSSKVSSLKEMTQLYLGFWTGQEAWDLSVSNKISNHPLNQRSRQYWELLPIGKADAQYPLLVRQYVWDIDQLSTVTKNAWAIDIFARQRTAENTLVARKCLMLRLQGNSEEEIQQELGIPSSKEYYKWQVGSFLDTASGRYRDPLEDWLKACEFFELEPNQELLDQVIKPRPISVHRPKVVVPKNREEHDNIDSRISGFKHSPDYRSIKMPNGQSFALTDKQSQVVSILHDNLKQGTPELSTAFVVEEVYPGVSEKRLKRLFNNNEVYDNLIEAGSMRGTIRLKVDFS